MKLVSKKCTKLPDEKEEEKEEEKTKSSFLHSTCLKFKCLGCTVSQRTLSATPICTNVPHDRIRFIFTVLLACYFIKVMLSSLVP